MDQTTKRPSRRSVLKGAAALTGAMVAPMMLKTATAQERTVFLQTYGGIYTQAEEAAYIKPFTAETGIAVKTITPWSYPKLKAQVQSKNYDFDISTMNPGEIYQAREEGLLEPIDWSVVDRSKIPPHMILHDVAIGSIVLSTNLCYRKDKFPNGNGPRTWADFWDVKKFPGPRGMFDRSWTSLEFALLADGVPMDKLFPLDIDRAFKKLDQIKPHIKVWWSQGSQSQQLMRDAEVIMTPLWNARAQELIDQKVPIEMVWEGAEDHTTFWYVAKGTPRAKDAWRFAAFAVQPKQLAEMGNRTLYGPQDERALEFIKPELKNAMPTLPEHWKVGFLPDYDWLGPRLPALKERWTQWLAS